MKTKMTGIVSNISTNPFQTFSRKKSANTGSTSLVTYDVSFDLCEYNGNISRVWFQRAFRFPPVLEEGDEITAIGRFGQFFGLIAKKNFYAVKIIDKSRKKEYTSWRNKDYSCEDPEGPRD